MINDMKQVIEYLSEYMTDPIPRFILQKEICKEPVSSLSYRTSHENIYHSKWYRQLADEQMDNGSWGRFHTQNTKEKPKRRFVTTELALRRARELSLDKEDRIVTKSILLMERYLKDEESWTDNNERHYGFEVAFKALIAANLTQFDPDNPLIYSRREICAKNITKAFESGNLSEEVWEEENRKENEILLRAYMVYPVWLLQYKDCISDTIQRKYLDYLWNRNEGIYYVSNDPPSKIKFLESREFSMWLYCLENLSGFSMFPEFMNNQITEHLYHEINRLVYEAVELPPAPPIFYHYSENWSNRVEQKSHLAIDLSVKSKHIDTHMNARKNDMILRIARLLAKCE